MVTSCSSRRTGCLISALAKRVRPRLRFSMNRVSAAMWLPLTGRNQSLNLVGAVMKLQRLTGDALRWQERKLSKRIPLVQTV